MKLSRPFKIIVLGIVVVSLLLGVVICFSLRIDPPQFDFIIEMEKTRYNVGEKIFFKTVLTNEGWLPVTIVTGKPGAFVNIYDETGKELRFYVYDDDGNIIWEFPNIQLLIALSSTLWPRQPFYLLAPHSEWGVKAPSPWQKVGYSLRPEKPGRYKITSVTSFGISRLWRRDIGIGEQEVEIHAEPVWIEIVDD